MTILHKFEGREVIGTKVAIANAGDGLSEALAIDPEELSHGTTVYVVLECVVDSVTFKRVKDTEALTRVQRLKAGTATLVDKAMVGEVLEAQRVKIEHAKGVERLDFTEGDEGEPKEGDGK